MSEPGLVSVAEASNIRAGAHPQKTSMRFTGAVAVGPIAKGIFSPTRTLATGVHDMAVGDRIAALVPHNQYGMVVTLIGLILVLNGVAIVLRSRVAKKLRGH